MGAGAKDDNRLRCLISAPSRATLRQKLAKKDSAVAESFAYYLKESLRSRMRSGVRLSVHFQYLNSFLSM